MEERFRIQGAPEELASVLDRIEALVLEQGLSPDLASEMRLVAEEALTNVLHHAYEPQEKTAVEVTLRVEAAEVRLLFRDRGRAFNPLESGSPRFDLPVEQRPLGGLGIHLIKTLTDEQIYSREGEENVLVLVKRRASLPL
ncbi:MAG: ATP-binding protein [Vicinamibacteria bacterium]